MRATRKVSKEWQALTELPALTSIEIGIFSEQGDQAKRERVRAKSKGTIEGSATLAEIATAHEFGLGVPQRSFLRAWFDENESAIFAKLLERFEANGPARWALSLNQVALWAQADVQLRIVRHIPPPLSAARIKQKKSSTPLIDTGQLRAAITARVNGTPPR